MVLKEICQHGYLKDSDIEEFVARAWADETIDGKRILFIIPDQTRSMPMPQMFRALYQAVHGRAAKMDFLIALGTHPPMTDILIQHLLGITAEERQTRYADIGIFNHEWQNPDALAEIGIISEEDIAAISGGLMRQAVRVTINKRVLEYDLVCIVGPVFPHEVVGFSGGNKYFFPGVSGAEILNLFHWLGALITNYVINGTKYTPVREVVDRAAALIPVEKRCF
ncbi:MAG TPA: lactate racemase domain-containing protein, partial [Candidatus Hydrogenedentes bacterium]|nr:lactate racemase domain-containing protein [Candidatus Hydrogenedentota bacterium]